jgi:hypothetical protein
MSSSDSMRTNPVDPGDLRTFTLDWAELLTSLGGAETIGDSTWEVPEPLIKADDDKYNTSTSIQLDFTDAVIGRNYVCYNRVTTSSGLHRRRRALIIPVRDAATFSPASNVKETLDAIRAAMARRATAAQQSRTIGNTTIQFMSIPDLIVAETKFQQLYNQERRAERIRNGEPLLKTVHTRFVLPQ